MGDWRSRKVFYLALTVFLHNKQLITLSQTTRLSSTCLSLGIPFPHSQLACERLSPPPTVSLSLSLHRHPYLCIPLDSHFVRYNKQTNTQHSFSSHIHFPLLMYPIPPLHQWETFTSRFSSKCGLSLHRHPYLYIPPSSHQWCRAQVHVHCTCRCVVNLIFFFGPFLKKALCFFGPFFEKSTLKNTEKT